MTRNELAERIFDNHMLPFGLAEYIADYLLSHLEVRVDERGIEDVLINVGLYMATPDVAAKAISTSGCFSIGLKEER